MKIDLRLIEDVAKDLYIRALKILPDDIKQGLQSLNASETDATAGASNTTAVTPDFNAWSWA